MPLSRLDLPHIVEAIGELHRIIAYPPAERWQAPKWLIEQYKHTTLGKAGASEKPSHGGLIHAAKVEVLNRLMPPWHHSKLDCPEITESLLDMRQKVKLIELRELLLDYSFGERLVANRSEALLSLAFLESVANELKGIGGSQPSLPAQEGQAPLQPKAVSEQIDPIARAIAFAQDQVRKTGKRPTWEAMETVTGRSKTTLWRDDAFKAAWKMLKTLVVGCLPRGGKTRQGDVDAYSDEKE